MIEVKVKTLWENKAGINQKYADEAVAKTESLVIIYRGDTMEIPADEVISKIISRSGPYPNRFGPGTYYLVYYLWKPTAVQPKML